MSQQFIQRFFAVALSLALAACTGSGELRRSQERLVAVVDAGSSGSRIHLYKTTPGDSFVKIRQLFTNKDTPHELSWYDGKRGEDSAPGQAGAAGIQPLLSALADYMRSNGIDKDQVSVSVLATAGMRMVDATTSGTIYQSVKTTITSNGFLVRQVGTLTGQNEGLYAWADANYLAGNFKPGAVTQGIVEVGGASSQVAFVTSDTSNKSDLNTTTIMLNGVRYPVFSVSYLGLGLNQARQAMVNDNASGGVGASVCYPNNATGLPATYDAGIGNLRVSTTGSQFNTAACQGVFSKKVTEVAIRTSNGYPLTQISSLPGFDTTQFLGLSSVHGIFKDWGALGTANPQQTLEAEVASRCSGYNAWPHVLTQYKNIPSIFAQNACANATYLNVYLFSPQSLGIRPAWLSGIASIQGNKLTWTRGYVLIDPLP